MVYPQRKLGIVFAPADDRGDVGVQIQKRKLLVNYKRLQLKVAASQMYPEDYDFPLFLIRWRTGKQGIRWNVSMYRIWKLNMRRKQMKIK